MSNQIYDNDRIEEALIKSVRNEACEELLDVKVESMFGGQQLLVCVDDAEFSFKDDGDYKVADEIVERVNDMLGTDWYVRSKSDRYMEIFSDSVADALGS
jgi:hypothetical protein